LNFFSQTKFRYAQPFGSAIQFYSCIGVTTAPGLMTNGPDKNPKNDLMNAWLLADI
jgi:hypothetical protein